MIVISIIVLIATNDFKGKMFLLGFLVLIGLARLVFLISPVYHGNMPTVLTRSLYVIGGVMSIAAWAFFLTFIFNLKSLIGKLNTTAGNSSIHAASNPNGQTLTLSDGATKQKIAVKDGFSWPAFFFGPIWAWVKGMIGLGFLLLLGNIVLTVFFILLQFSGMDSISKTVFTFMIIIGWITYIGFNGNAWLKKSLEKKGYVVVAKDNVAVQNQ